MKAVIRGNEKAVIKVHVGKKISWQYKATPETGSPVTAAKIVEFINTLNGDAQTEKWVVELQAQLAGKTIEQLIFDTHQMEEILADLYASKYPLTQDPKTNEIAPEDRERFDGMTTYAQVLSAYIVSGLLKCGLLTFTAELQK